MKTWRAPTLRRLPGTGQIPALHDQASGTRRPSASGPTGRMYVCGITPYDATHIGHSATYIAFDLLNRAWRDAGLAVTYVQNVTDVDDPLLERATQTGDDWRALAERQIALFCEDMAALRVIPPEHYIGAVESIPLVSDAIARLVEAGAVYAVDDDRYFDIATDPGFGRVSRWSRAQMLDVFAERGGDPDRPGKRDVLDCLVWLAERPGEPSWEARGLTRGRPGWHIECTAIALEYLGGGFDVQGGGSDLIFPHHEMCAAQAAVLLGGGSFASVYAYQGMVGLHGEKMSKSKGNLVFSSRLRAEGTDPMAIRLAVLAHHYREDWEWTDDQLTAATARLERWRAAAACPAGADGTKVLAGVRDALAADLDAPAALAVVDAWADATLAGTASDPDAPALVAQTCDALLGVALTDDRA